MQRILIIDTGGTFNKRYDPIKGELVVERNSLAINSILSRWKCADEAVILSVVGKDSLEMTSADRIEILSHIAKSEHDRIIVIHGTDTIEQTAIHLDDAELAKAIVLCGAMIPYAFDPVEATANFAAAWGYLRSPHLRNGIYLSMNGYVLPYRHIKKDKNKAKFLPLGR